MRNIGFISFQVLRSMAIQCSVNSTQCNGGHLLRHQSSGSASVFLFNALAATNGCSCSEYSRCSSKIDKLVFELHFSEGLCFFFERRRWEWGGCHSENRTQTENVENISNQHRRQLNGIPPLK